jgi:hypothetical protein
MTMTAEDHRLLIEQVRELARTREHKLQARQLAALETQTTVSILAMRTYLDGRPLRGQQADMTDIAATVRNATAAAVAAGSGISPYAKAGGQPASRELHAGPEAHQARPGRRPGAKVTEPGIYYYNGHVYKVIRSQYGERHLQARRLNPKAKAQKFTYAEGMMGVLRAADKMTAAQSLEYEKLYDYAACTDCGLPLENDLSRRRRIGPVCWEKNGHADTAPEEDED